ncbi:MAG: DUF1460 domain-containing protein [Desulfuromusa sp.]|nr:DUF1460 domain-containing protein [Desulfuromusa sp.]
MDKKRLPFLSLLSKKKHWHICSRNWGIILFCVLPLFVTSCSVPKHKPIDLGDWDRIEIEQLLDKSEQIQSPGDKIAFISAAFLKTPYRASTLIGSAETAEVFVLRLDGVDCFTFLDYVESLRRATDFDEFKQMLQQIRYRNGQVTFLDRNHFFSAWGNALFAPLRDVTAQVGGGDVRWVEKQLNEKRDGTLYLSGYPVRTQVVAFIPPEVIDKSVLSRLQNGDYIGIYSPYPGLDVSHTGIVIIKRGKVFLRHASSRFFRKKVRDEELLPYLGGKKGLIVYRPITVN